MIGFIALGLAALFSLAAALLYLVQHRREAASGQIAEPRFAKMAVYLAGAAVIIASVDLMYIILTDQFQYKYVWSYSSLDLAFAYKISAFWAGQEGSFLLWLLIHALVGMLLVYRRSMRAITLSFYNWLQVAVLIMTLSKNPFMMLAEVKEDGAGMNPLLQDPWMAIHPPVIFIGYALLAVPFCYALGSLFLPDKKQWISRALSWSLLASSMLGAGMFIGGYWAYKVLGWGGYWGWDPVENSSLVPWLISAALVHCLFWARVRAAALKPAYFAAIFSYGLVLYGTFLTRSGVLGDFSVHSFSDDGIGFLLALVMAAVVLAGLILLTVQWNTLPSGELYSSLTGRCFTLGLGMLVLTFMAVLVAFGMSLPLFTSFVGQGQSVAPVFYNKTMLPLAAVLLVLLLISPSWRADERQALPRPLYGALALCMAVGIAAGSWLDFGSVLASVVLGEALAMTVLHLYLGGRRMSRSGALAHIGIGIMTAGILLSSAGSHSEIRLFAVNEPQELFGHQVSYVGEETDAATRRQLFTIDDQTLSLLTKLDSHGMESAKEPGIYHGFGGDLYIAPAKQQAASEELVLERRKPVMQGGLLLRFDGLGEGTMPGAEENRMFQAKLHLSDGNAVEEVVLIMVQDGVAYKSVPLAVLDKRYQLQLTGISGDGSRIRLEFIDYQTAASQFEAEFSYKPFVWLVWLGTVLITLGGLIAAVKYFKRVNHVQ